MRNLRTVLAACTSLLLLGACAATDPTAGNDPTQRAYGSVAFEPCTVGQAAGGGSAEALCGRLEVPEVPGAADGRQLSLHITWLPAGSNATDDAEPLFFIAGGPGQAASDVAGVVAASLREVLRQRDIILVDQRGTGRSNPLTCLDANGEEMVLEDMLEPSIELLQDYVRRCAAGLQGRADPRYYTTIEAVADLEAVRVALGIGQLNLMGASYGTRVAQRYASTHPRRVHAMVLDGVAPNDLVVGGEFATTFEDALALQAAQCAREPACRGRFPADMREQLRKVAARLQAVPAEVDYRDPTTNEDRRDTVSSDTLVGLAFAFSYAPQTASLLPLVLDEAERGRYGPLMSLARLMSRNMEGAMNVGMQWSVICAEDADRFDPASVPEGTVLGAEVAERFFAACAQWPRGQRPADFNQPFASDLPVLLLSGELDPVTPPRYAERVLAGTPNGRHLVLRGQGHGTMGLGCMPKLLARFLESGDAQALEAQCLDTLAYVPTFTSFNGWEP